MIRYADDFVILCKTQTEAEEALEQVRAWMSKAGLTLHPEKTRIVDATQRGGFEFDVASASLRPSGSLRLSVSLRSAPRWMSTVSLPLYVTSSSQDSSTPSPSTSSAALSLVRGFS